MFGSKLISKIKDKIKLYCYKIKNIPNWYKTRILEVINYYNDCKYKFSHLKETNFALGIDHLYKGNLSDAILRFKLVDKFFASREQKTSDLKVYYWLALTYFLKNDYSTALDYAQKSSIEDKIGLKTFLQNYKNANEIPQALWQQYRDLIASYYTNNFHNDNNTHLPYSFIRQTLDNITDLPDNYTILELGSNTGLVGYEIQKRFPESFSLSGVEVSNRMNNLVSAYYPNTKIYDQILDISIPDFIKQSSDKFDVILSFCALSFTNNLKTYFDAVYSLLNNSGYFAFCLPIAASTSFSSKRKEFIFNFDEIITTLNATKFTILNSQKLILAENNKYCIVVCKKTN
ncbi:methyltransferase [Rickettsia endosymbiont of Halotydeus destructor]|uniref:methyltransferase n=1 Tax=Rickettsia endosymbiont of Halotydeus destructor TaxID=2996754 RepID=UPI003BAEB713